MYAAALVRERWGHSVYTCPGEIYFAVLPHPAHGSAVGAIESRNYRLLYSNYIVINGIYYNIPCIAVVAGEFLYDYKNSAKPAPPSGVRGCGFGQVFFLPFSRGRRGDYVVD